ncbi:sigma-70 family RNA polymerase sigma factor [Kitasatospora sp. RG8]|uniref:sigma-70 family RNA polymerase sigma factor n=1 Tax=Kitasatospora sp. RG8 TaxID=2820815 RepID=UPI001AE05DA3|nr:sigma-70 family RNA polymerase sigma factor [Kitasatospora sp. RG8]MBP0451325.1 sigma-70 family RNA polymerase sigma factor [Kitasatospora sp. RG8]
MAIPGSAPRWDEQLQLRLARGEETALGELYDQLAPMVHGLAGRILADQAAAAQLTREIFAHVWEHPESFDPAQGSLRSWIGSLTHRRAVDRLRVRRAAEVPAFGDGYRDGPGGEGGEAVNRSSGSGTYGEDSPVEEEIRTVATAARIQVAVDSLPHSLRETITVSYYDGRTYQETARRLGISEQAAKQRMRLGLELLATELAEERDRQRRARNSRGRTGDDRSGEGRGGDDRAGDGRPHGERHPGEHPGEQDEQDEPQTRRGQDDRHSNRHSNRHHDRHHDGPRHRNEDGGT